MVKLEFKLKNSYMPDLTQKDDKEETKYGGIRLTYFIYKVYYFKLFNREITLFKKRCGRKTFLRPYKKFWDKRLYRLPNVYWGKKSHPLTRLWVIIASNLPLDTHKIKPEATLRHQYVKLFGYDVRSKDITTKLFRRVNKFSLSIN